MAYPTVADMQNTWASPAMMQTDAQKLTLQNHLDDARNTVLGRLAARYGYYFPLWAAATPPRVFTWIRRLAYAFFGDQPVTTQTTENRAAKSSYSDILKEIDDFLKLDNPTLMGADGLIIAPLPGSDFPGQGVDVVLRRTQVAIHSMGPAEGSLILPAGDGRTAYLRSGRWR